MLRVSRVAFRKAMMESDGKILKLHPNFHPLASLRPSKVHHIPQKPLQHLKGHGIPVPPPLNARGPMDVTRLGISTWCNEAQPSKASIASIVSDAGRRTERSTGQFLKAPMSIKVTWGWGWNSWLYDGVSSTFINMFQDLSTIVKPTCVLWIMVYHLSTYYQKWHQLISLNIWILVWLGWLRTMVLSLDYDFL